MVADLQPGEVVIAEKNDRISRLPLPEAELLVAAIRAARADVFSGSQGDLSPIATALTTITRVGSR